MRGGNRKGIKHTPEVKARISASMKGKRNAVGKHHISAEARAAMGKATFERWERYRAAKEEAERDVE